MRRLVVIALGCALLAGCASTTPKEGIPSTGSTLAPESALTQCVSPQAARPKPVDAPVSANFAGDRVTTAISLDGGKFRATPASSSTRPVITADLALCNELAAATNQNSTMSGAAQEAGFSFGLALVTIEVPVRNRFVASGSAVTQPNNPTPAGYRKRLAWIGVGAPAVIASCPKMTNPPTSAPAGTRLPGYQIVVIDAQTGADGVLYSAAANNICGFPGDSGPSAQPAWQFASAPWTLVQRLPDGRSADITYQRRSCDGTISGTVDGKPTVLSDRTHVGLVSVEIQRAFEQCGTPIPNPARLRGPLPTSALPAKLIHAPVGAENTTR